MKVEFLSKVDFKDKTIDVSTATLQSVVDCYNSLLWSGNSNGAFPGSSEWRKAKVFTDLAELVAKLRPDAMQFRKEKIIEIREEKLANSYID